MARPETINDIELEDVEFASVEVDKINTAPWLLKGYTAFLEAVTKAGATVAEPAYRGAGVRFLRYPTPAEAQSQLESAQRSWDDGKRYYEQLASVGSTEYEYHRGMAQTYAASEGLVFPPPYKPISDFDAVVKSIDEVTA